MNQWPSTFVGSRFPAKELKQMKLDSKALKRDENGIIIGKYHVIDDNAAVGWSWRSVPHMFVNGTTVIPNLGKNTAWLEGSPSAIRSGEVWNDYGTVRVKLWPESDTSLTFNASAIYNASCGCVRRLRKVEERAVLACSGAAVAFNFLAGSSRPDRPPWPQQCRIFSLHRCALHRSSPSRLR